MYDIGKILLELGLFEIENEIPDKMEQYSLQSINDNDVWEIGTGEFQTWYDRGVRERDFSIIKLPKKSETYRFITENRLCRTRVMKLHPKSCYSWHQDDSKRLHLALQTNDKCFFVVENEIIRIKSDGFPFLLDTTKFHTAINANLENFTRIHLVGCVYV